MLALTVDFGSTFTKIVVIDVDHEKIVARSMSPSTVDTDINTGLGKALEKIGGWRSLRDKVSLKLACSSAAGGLRIVAVGLVPDLTGEAARRAALSAGGKVIGVYSHRLTEEDLKHIEESNPDMILLSGGTDGGDRDTVQHNGRLISKSGLSSPVVIACNREAAPAVRETLSAGGKISVLTENVMPDLGKINVGPAKKIIRDLFVKHITKAKGLEKAKAFVDLIMPTPSASLTAAQLLADGTVGEPGRGAVMVVEVGGATTNVYSVFEEPKPERNVIRKGVPEGRVKRTVEGDLGVRVGATSLVEAAGVDNVMELMSRRADLDASDMARQLTKNPSSLPDTRVAVEFDEALARLAVRLAVERHVGTVEEVYTPTGRYYFQTGKNFEALGIVIGSGGPIVYSRNPSTILSEVIFREERPDILKPKQPKQFIDRDYILWSAGLLSIHHPVTAFRILKRSLLPA